MAEMMTAARAAFGINSKYCVKNCNASITIIPESITPWKYERWVGERVVRGAMRGRGRTLTGVETVEGSFHTGPVGDDRTRQRPSTRIRLHKGVSNVGHTKCDHLLRCVDGFSVGERLANSDVLEQDDQR